MPRMIDADALIEVMEMHATTMTTMSECSKPIESRAKGEMKRTCIADVANAPTIDAIPVEWIENVLKEWLKGNASFEMCGAISVILGRWRKEQEAIL